MANRIEKFQQNFLWGGIGDKPKFHLVKWATICTPISWQNLPNSSFLEKNLVHSIRMKHFSKLDCFWNSSLKNSIYSWVELKSRKLEFHLNRTRVPCE